VGTVPAGARHDLTDAQWELLEPLLPAVSGVGGPRNRPDHSRSMRLGGGLVPTLLARRSRAVRDVAVDLRAVPVLAARRDMGPDRRGSAATRRRRRSDLLGRVRGLHDRASPPACAGARRHPDRQVESPGAEPADHALGRSRGGWTTKLHLAAEQGRKPLSMVLTAGQRGDSPQFVPVLERIRVRRVGWGRVPPPPDRVLADKAYPSRANRAYLRRRGIRATIPIKRDQYAQPAQTRITRWAATGVQPDPLPPTPLRRVQHQPAQTTPSGRHPLCPWPC
jgi:transposase